MNQKKPILHSFEGTKLVAGDDIKISTSNHLTHDSGLSNICMRFIQLPNVYDVNALRNDNIYDKSSLVPDAEVLVVNGDQTLTIAIEFENTPKSKPRLINKFNAYSQSNEHEYVIYVLNNEKAAVNYANTFYNLQNERKAQHSNLNAEKFYFFVRNPSADKNDFINSFKPIYPTDIKKLLTILTV